MKVSVREVIMKNKIVGVSLKFSHMNFKNIDLIPFSSYNSLLDYDIVIIDLAGISSEYDCDKDYNGRERLYSGKRRFIKRVFPLRFKTERTSISQHQIA
ncbi:hypothetical protein LLG32_08520 [Lactococcus cremoris]|nr:hypothetical protein LLG32_08520 [Lactococcus cremoris]